MSHRNHRNHGKLFAKAKCHCKCMTQYRRLHVKSSLSERWRCYLDESQTVKPVEIFDHLHYKIIFRILPLTCSFGNKNSKHDVQTNNLFVFTSANYLLCFSLND